jgi:hypothetical protein
VLPSSDLLNDRSVTASVPYYHVGSEAEILDALLARLLAAALRALDHS